MHRPAAVLCHDKACLQTLQAVLNELGIGLVTCPTRQEALESALAGRCSTLIVDFDLPGAEEVIRMAALLPATQKPTLLAVASRVWPGTGEAFHSGASRILYRPLDADEVKDALKAAGKAERKLRRSARYEMKTLVYLELKSGTLPAIGIDIGEHGLAVQATEPVPISSNLAFRCELPGTKYTLRGHAEVIWASDQGRAGMFFSELAPAARKQLRHWLSKRSAASRRAHSRNSHSRSSHHKNTQRVEDLMPPAEGHVSFAALE